MNILLDYFFPITAITPTPAASTAFLKQACFVAKPDGATEGDLTLCTSLAAAQALCDTAIAKAELAALFAGGVSRVYVLTVSDLDLAASLEGHESDFFTLIISSDYSDADITASLAALTVNGDLTFTAVIGGSSQNEITVALVNDDAVTAGNEVIEVDGLDIVIKIDSGVSTATQIKAAFDASEDATALASCSIVAAQDAMTQAAAAEAPLAGGDGLFLGSFKGVTAISSTSDSFLATQAAIENRSAFPRNGTYYGQNMAYSFGKLLSNVVNWTNQQYISLPNEGDAVTLGEANAYFDDKVSFVISDSEFANRLALFVAGGKAIVAPYIVRNLEIDLQSKALQYVSGNQPGYTKTQAALLEDELQKVVELYIERQWIEVGKIDVKLEQENFVASGYINIREPKALWRVFGELRQTL